MARIALVSQLDLPTWEVDDAPLHAALRALGHEISQPAWDDEGVDWGTFDLAVLRTTWNYAHQVDRFVAWAEEVERATQLVHDAAVVRWNTHKSYLRQLEQAGVTLAPTLWFERGTDAEEAWEAMVGEGWDRVFLKPLMGQTARETLRGSTTETDRRSVMEHLARLLPVEPMMAQPYLASVETRGEHSAVFFGGSFSHGVRKVPVPGDYRVQDDFGASDMPVEMSGAQLSLALQTLEAARGLLRRSRPFDYARIDMLEMAGGRWVLNELEVVEPSLFFRHAPRGAARFAQVLHNLVGPDQTSG